MLYIITEDAGSGHQFWKNIYKTYIINDPFIVENHVIKGYGIERIYSVLKNQFLGHNDTLLAVIDDVGNNAVRAAMSDIEQDSIERGYKCSFFVTYCFEEIFLSFSELDIWMDIENDLVNNYNSNYNKITDIVKFIRSHLHDGTDYWENRTSLIMDYVEKYNSEFFQKVKENENQPLNVKISYREHFSAIILSLFTDKFKGVMRITKGELGSCWQEDCASVALQRNTACSRCKLSNGYSAPYPCIELKNAESLKYKLDTLEKKSIVSNMPIKFSCLLDYMVNQNFSIDLMPGNPQEAILETVNFTDTYNEVDAVHFE